MNITKAIQILQNREWFYEGATKIDGVRCYIMRKYDRCGLSQQTVRYFTLKGIRAEVKKGKTNG